MITTTIAIRRREIRPAHHPDSVARRAARSATASSLVAVPRAARCRRVLNTQITGFAVALTIDVSCFAGVNHQDRGASV